MGDLKLNGTTSGTITVTPTAVAGTNTITLPASTGTVALTANPTFTGAVTATTVTSPSATALTIQSAGTTAMTIDTSQNVGIGTSSPSSRLQVSNGASGLAEIQLASNVQAFSIGTGGSTSGYGVSALYFYDKTANTERMRIDSSGNLLVGTASSSISNVDAFSWIKGIGAYSQYQHSSGAVSGNFYIGFYYNGGAAIGSITQNGTTAVSYNTSSDYRLKENVTPMTNGLATVSALKPVIYDWVSDKSQGEGFIAHELQSVIPLAVTGEKDAVDEEGNIKPQGVDYSKIVVHLVAALQELSAKNDALEARLAALEAK